MDSRSKIVAHLLSVTTDAKEPAIVISGPDGAGKSTILERVAKGLGERPNRIFRANPVESSWHLSGLSSMFTATTLTVDVEITKYIPAEPGEPVNHYGLAREIREKFLGTLSPGSVIILDDADLLDADSQVVISSLATKLAGTGISFIASVAAVHADSVWSSFRELEVTPLDESEAVSFVAELAGPGAHPLVVDTVVQYSDGLPQTIAEFVAKLSTRQLKGISPLVLPLVPGNSTKARIDQELAVLTEAQLRVMELCAMASLAEPLSIVSSEGDDIDALDDLLSNGWIERHGPYVQIPSKLVRSVLYWHASPAKRRNRHTELRAKTTAWSLSAFHGSFLGRDEAHFQSLYTAAEDFLSYGYIDMGVEIVERA
ncbi:MAG: hypothetical protein Q4P23_09670, partial [Micrococcaceae bacterium]|nr:hypothetical protein [Micrococcaceae bacterium]